MSKFKIFATGQSKAKGATDQVINIFKKGPLDLWKMDIADLQKDT